VRFQINWIYMFLKLWFLFYGYRHFEESWQFVKTWKDYKNVYFNRTPRFPLKIISNQFWELLFSEQLLPFYWNDALSHRNHRFNLQEISFFTEESCLHLMSEHLRVRSSSLNTSWIGSGQYMKMFKTWWSLTRGSCAHLSETKK
jgi:hypothetical protein